MAQETNPLQTQNAVNNTADTGLFGSLLSGIGSLATSVAPLYALKLQGDVLTNQTNAAASVASAASAASLASKPSATAAMPAWLKPWMIWTAVAGLALLLVSLMVRRRG